MEKRYFYYRIKGGIRKIDLQEIYFICAAKNYTIFQAPEYNHLVRMPFEKALAAMPEGAFERISRSFALSQLHVDQVSRDVAVFKSGLYIEFIPSKEYYEKYMSKMNILDSDGQTGEMKAEKMKNQVEEKEEGNN